MTTEITAADIGNVLNGLISSGENELQNMGQADLDKEYWHFMWDDSATLERNIYVFHDRLKLYGSFCRRWEEKHNGTCCVVERVRDTYLMPKICEFAAKVRASSNSY